jgi:1,4-alpha-glucan branching enzyme
MATISVQFRYLTGLKRPVFTKAVLRGSWDQNGHFSTDWTETVMRPFMAEDGCPAFEITIQLATEQIGTHFFWGVAVDGPAGVNQWGIPTEIQDAKSTQRVRQFELTATPEQTQEYYLTYARRLGARKVFTDLTTPPNLRFAVWAPHAQAVDVVFGQKTNGYIADDGDGIDLGLPVIPLQPGSEGIWSSDVIPSFTAFEGTPYMFRIQNAQGRTTIRSDMFSRHQIGQGFKDPKGAHYTGSPQELDGTVGCSVVTSLDTVARDFSSLPGAPSARISETEFWSTEFTPERTVPSRVEDLVIYELHIGALGFGKSREGNLADAMELLEKHLIPLGINAVELMPMAEFPGSKGWGYGDSHHFVIESSAGGRDQYKHFVRACHQNGIAVIQDVCYNHWDIRADRAPWAYDSERDEDNSFYWYEGRSQDYSNPAHGYIQNGSTGRLPRLWEETVRSLFVSSAAAFLEEFHVDGFRVDLTQALHSDNVHEGIGGGVDSANAFGTKLLREWSRTLRILKPSVMLIAEDHSNKDFVTKPTSVGGLGFNSTWFAEFYHDLIGDSNDHASGRARLLYEAGFGGNWPLAMGQFATTLQNTQFNKIVYHESHDEAGANTTRRTMVVAVQNDNPSSDVRQFAEARSRVAFGLSLLSAGTPMFLMAEEVAAQKRYTVDDFNPEDIHGKRVGSGAKMFRFYQELILFARKHPASRSQAIETIYTFDPTRVIAFTRRSGNDQLLIIASFNNAGFLDGYRVVRQPNATQLPDGLWREVFNSDATVYGGTNVGNFGLSTPSSNGAITVRLPANSFLVFLKE